ncbi:RNA methyltransferase [Nitratireductor aquimarinus]|uniref:RNA methyltransferase n=1 Tax=Alphaproteobacteria TaxID=28211 RepID=UPI0019D368E5|nr:MULTISPECIES: RNA methyltransferase [Alphaproteobacteria]MBY6021394.1 RNA methyltransferase [Nitratireductor sp. DP7N14-4]MBN7756608.1 RNA methyltransferase [Nitratireductor aquimarinus]MBN7777018.1 RNA methyltransferase [Nitratireductor pacificus]MBN7780352.1 RNA methyltransferase [Nitratireductor pacificus]MBN7789159.1 RNA methyltransferase [Nitratireductor aquimarinus]
MAGTDKQQDMLAEGPAIILVEPQLGENIGMVARAMANFGLAELRLVAPRDGWPNEKARASASRADHVIDAATVYETPAEAVADLNFVLATTARPRDNFKPVRGPVEAASDLRSRFAGGQKTGIMFGRERWGLTNEEVALADEIVTFPVNPAFASLNIAQAVLLMSYEWIKTGDQAVTPPEQALAPAQKLHIESLMGYLDNVLDERGYFRTEDKKPKMMENLRALFTRPGFTVEELAVLRGVLTSLEKFSPRNPRGSGAPER